MYSRRSIIKFSRSKKSAENRKKYIKKTVFVLVLFFFVIGILAWQSGNEKVVIADIGILGNEVVNKSDILEIMQVEMSGKYGWLFHRDSIFIYPKKSIEKKLFALNKRIQEVNVHRDSLTAITVEISERKPEYVWCLITEGSPTSGSNQKKCFFMDELGYIFAEAPQFSGPVFFEFYGNRDFVDNPLGNYFLNEKKFLKFVTFKNDVNKLGFKLIALVEQEEMDYDLLLDDGAKIMFNEKQDFAEVLENLSSSIETIQASKKSLEYIDLRFGSKVFYRFTD